MGGWDAETEVSVSRADVSAMTPCSLIGGTNVPEELAVSIFAVTTSSALNMDGASYYLSTELDGITPHKSVIY